ncbi:hypothetical protein [Bradyrhizobium sp.]|nr:hypothetical protein [Bradyrhizobium sp.]
MLAFHLRGRVVACAIRENSMLDLIMLALGLGFFAAAVGYTYACERL